MQDRWHNGMAHSDFLNAGFCRKYWLPFLRDGTIVEDAEEAKSPPWWVWFVSTFQIRYIVVLVLLLLAYHLWTPHAG